MWISNRTIEGLKGYWLLVLLITLWLPSTGLGFDPYTGILAPNDLREQIRMGIGWGAGAQTDIVSQRCFADISPAVRIPRRGQLRTHPWLAEQALTVFEREYGVRLDDIDPGIKPGILLGTIEEDLDLIGGATGVPAYANIDLNECIDYLHLHIETIPFNPHSRSENHFYDGSGGLPPEISGVSPHAVSAIAWATTSSINTHIWERAKQAARSEATRLDGWRSLGHILHLLQDVGVPAHTRNDIHPFKKEPYEKMLGEISYSDHASKYEINLHNVKPTSFQFSTVDQFIKKLAEYTQANYFSEDSVFLKNNYRDLSRNENIKTYNEGKSFSRYVIANFPDPNFSNFPDLSGQKERRIATYKLKFFLRNPLCGPFDLIQCYPTTPDQAASISSYMTVDDESIVADYWRDMALRIIAISAELIKLFYDAVTAPHNPPTITSLTANPISVQTGGQSTIAVVASDPDAADVLLLTYDWSSTCGTLSGMTGKEDKTWTAPDIPGTCTVSVTVTDPSSAIDTASIDIEVTTVPSTAFTIGNRIQVATGDGANLNVRSTPGGPSVGQQLAGSWGTVIGGPVFADGRWWRQVDFDTGADGWVAEEFLGSGPPLPTVPFAYATLSVFNRTDPSAAIGMTVGPTVSVFNRAAPEAIAGHVEIGDQVVTTDNLNVRSAPGLSGTVLGVQSTGSQGTVIGGPVFSDGFRWWQIDYEAGPDGWSAEDFLEPLSSPVQFAYITFSVFNETDPSAEIGMAVGPAVSVFNAAAPEAITSYDRVQVDTGDGSNLNVRSTPGGPVVGQQPDGARGTVIGDAVFADGFHWREVNFDTGADGWVAEDFLEFPLPPVQFAYATLSVFNETDPSAVLGIAVGPVVSVFNAAAPDAVAGYAAGPIFSVKNVPWTAQAAFQWPAGQSLINVSQWFAAYNNDVNDGAGGYHAGLDIVSTNTTVVAADAGVVRRIDNHTYANANHCMGNVVLIDHDNGAHSLYAHLASITVVDGQFVPKGAQIGTIGNTGAEGATCAPFPAHLHFEVKAWNAMGNVHDDLGRVWGYTESGQDSTKRPNWYGYMNPLPYLEFAVTDLPPTVVRVTADNSPVRTGPDPSYTESFATVSSEQKFVAFSTYNGWYQVYLPSEHGPATGWVQGAEDASAAIAAVNDPLDVNAPARRLIGVSVREAPSTASNRMTYVWDRQLLAIAGQVPSTGGCAQPWYAVSLPDGLAALQGWVCGVFLDTP